MAAVPDCREPSTQGRYPVLLANFEAAYRCMQGCSKEFTKVLGEVRSSEPPEARKARIESARMTYEEAQKRCLDAVANLQEHLIRESISLDSLLEQSSM